MGQPLQTKATFHCFEIIEFSFYSISCYGLPPSLSLAGPMMCPHKIWHLPVAHKYVHRGTYIACHTKVNFSHLLQKDSNCMNLEKMLFTFTKGWDWTSCDIQGSVVYGTSNQTKPKIFWVFLFNRRSLTNLQSYLAI